MNPFEEAKKIVTDEWVSEITSPFMTNRVLSTSPDTFAASVKINDSVSGLSKKEIASLFNMVVPKSSYRPYFHYPKKAKQTSKKLIAKIIEVFSVNEMHALQIIEILEDKNIEPESLFGLRKGE